MKNILLFSLVLLLTTSVVRAQTEVTFYTNMGDFVVETYDTLQPITAGNFIDLVNAEFYDGVIFHRVIDGFMIQGGDPTGTGFGGPGYTIPDEFDPLTSNVQTAVAMANAGPNTGGSQFFINLVNNTGLDSGYPVFGMVTSNFSVVQDIGVVPTNANDRPLEDVVMDSLRVTLVGPYVGINEISNQSFNISVFPNPAEDHISIVLNDEVGSGNDYTLRITDVLGQAIHTENLVQQVTTVDISSTILKGIYFVVVTDDKTNSQVVKKIVLR